MRKYKIKEVSLGYIVYRYREEDGTTYIQYWNDRLWDCRKYAKTYVTKSDAVSALVIGRVKGKEERESES